MQDMDFDGSAGASAAASQFLGSSTNNITRVIQRPTRSSSRSTAARSIPDPNLDADPSPRDLVDELIRMGVGRNVDSRSWNTTVQKCGTSIKRIRKRDNQHLRKRFRIQARTHLLSRRALLQTIFSGRSSYGTDHPSRLTIGTNHGKSAVAI